MSKVKYPDKEKIRIQIDEILDKSELFDATEDKSSTYTNDKIVQLKPVSDSRQRRAEQDKFRAISNQQFRGRYA